MSTSLLLAVIMFAIAGRSKNFRFELYLKGWCRPWITCSHESWLTGKYPGAQHAIAYEMHVGQAYVYELPVVC